MSESEIKKTPWQSRMYFILAVIFMLIPTAMKFYTGETQKLIVASGKLSDPNFDKTVVFIFKHGLEGAIGVVINRPLDAKGRENLPGFLQDKDLPLYWGGPVEDKEFVAVLERSPAQPDGTVELRLRKFDDAVKEDPGYLDKIEKSHKDGKDDYRIYLGSSGWAPFQLNLEFNQGVWASTELNHELVFYKGITPKQVWERAMTKASTKRKPRSPGTI